MAAVALLSQPNAHVNLCSARIAKQENAAQQASQFNSLLFSMHLPTRDMQAQRCAQLGVIEWMMHPYDDLASRQADQGSSS